MGDVEEFKMESFYTSKYEAALSPPSNPMVFEFENINFSVQIKDPDAPKASGLNAMCAKKPIVTKQILKDISGSVGPGQIMAIMGASGAGKTSLLNILAGRVRTGKIEGSVRLNGESLQKFGLQRFKRSMGYVMQDDLALPFLTVRETLTFNARLRLPKTMKKAEKLQRVEDLIAELSLTKCADTKIGGALVRGVSGGEKKRVNIANELITDPSLLFLDEPTTGLDSFTAYNIVETLGVLAKSGRSVVCTIHQPRSNIFNMFTTLLLLSEGRTVYFGPASDAVTYFAGLRYRCPTLSNPADFFIDLVTIDRRQEEAKKHTSKRVFGLIDEYAESDLASRALDFGTMGGDLARPSSAGTKSAAASNKAAQPGEGEANGGDGEEEEEEEEEEVVGEEGETGGGSGGSLRRKNHGSTGSGLLRVVPLPGTPSLDLSNDDDHDIECGGGVGAGAGAYGKARQVVGEQQVEEQQEEESGSGSNSSSSGNSSSGSGSSATAPGGKSRSKKAKTSKSGSTSGGLTFTGSSNDDTGYSVGFFGQMYLLFGRERKNYLRNPLATFVRGFQTIFMAIVVGVLYLGLDNGQKSIQDRTGALFFICIHFSFDGLFGAMISFIEEKELFLREHASGMYRVSAFFMSKQLIQLPLEILYPFLFSVICYFMIGFQATAERFVVFFLLNMLISFTAQSMGFMIGAVAKTMDVANAIAPLSIVVLFLFAGFYVNVDTIPDGIAWIAYISFMRYGFEALVLNEFTEDLRFSCSADQQREDGTCFIATGLDVRKNLSFEDSTLGIQVLALACLAVGFRLVAYIVLRTTRPQYKKD